MNNTSGIYGIRSLCHPERVYIGSAVNIKQRWYGHKRKLTLNKHENSKLQNHHNKYGENDLFFEVIAYSDKENLTKIEQAFIDLYKPWFNIYLIAGSPMGYRHSKEVKERMTETRTGKHPSKATRKKMREAGRGTKNHNYGKHPSRETKEKLIKRLLGNRYAGHLVINLETGIFYNSICEAARSTNIKACTLWSYLHGKCKNKTMFALV